jgi:hypothetical protein
LTVFVVAVLVGILVYRKYKKSTRIDIMRTGMHGRSKRSSSYNVSMIFVAPKEDAAGIHDVDEESQASATTSFVGEKDLPDTDTRKSKEKHARGEETGLVQDTEAAYETPRGIEEVLYDFPNSEVEMEKQSEGQKTMTSPGQSTSSSIGMQSKKVRFCGHLSANCVYG